jgi:hypothetical protein
MPTLSKEGDRIADNIRERLSPVVVVSALGILNNERIRVSDESATVTFSVLGILCCTLAPETFSFVVTLSVEGVLNA